MNYTSLNSSNAGGMSSSVGACGSTTDLAPSPSDSGVSELEATQKDRDGDTSRGTNDHEQALRTFEKERIWEMERRMKLAHESRLRIGAQKAMKLEQTLMMQTYQLQQDKHRLNMEAEKVTKEMSELKHETSILKTRLEETEWNLCEKTGEIALLKSQLKDAQSELTTKGHEYLQLKGEYKVTREALDRKQKEASKLQMDNDIKYNTIKQLQSEVNRLTAKIKECEVDLLKSKEESSSEIERLKTELKELREELSDVSLEGYEGIESGRRMRGIYEICKNANEYQWNSNDSSLEDAEVQRLNGEMPELQCSEICKAGSIIDRLKCEIHSKDTEFNKERRKWSEEKEKVIKYQKQLQLNYSQVYSKSMALEAEVDRLRMELKLRNTNIKNIAKLNLPVEL